MRENKILFRYYALCLFSPKGFALYGNVQWCVYDYCDNRVAHIFYVPNKFLVPLCVFHSGIKNNMHLFV